MARFGSKTGFTGLLFSKLTLIILLILCVYLAYSVYERFTVERTMSERLDSTQEEYTELEERRDTLLEKVDYLEGDSGIETEIRKHFDVAKEGEQVVIIVDEEEAEDAEFVNGYGPEAEDDPWYKFW